MPRFQYFARRNTRRWLLLMSILWLFIVVRPLLAAQESERVLHTFTGGSDGAEPSSLIADAKGNLYGTTEYGGDTSACAALIVVTGCGVVFELSPPSGGSGPWTETVLHTFTGGSNGENPSNSSTNPTGGLILDAKGNLYGTTPLGGDTAPCTDVSGTVQGCGVVFELSPPSGGSGPWTETMLYKFTGGSDGAEPNAGLIFDAKGNLYGTTQFGGDNSTCFSDFSDTAGCGVVFRLSPPNSSSGPWIETVLYKFTGKADGNNPTAALILDAEGKLYGTTPYNSGNSENECDCGAVFELSPPNGNGPWTETTLYTFTGMFTGGINGGQPYAGLALDAKGNLYGTTIFGGQICAALDLDEEVGCGVVFELAPPSSGSGPWTETVLYTFVGQSDGAMPISKLLFDSKGNLYGTALAGGTDVSDCPESSPYPAGCGVVFELSPPTRDNGPWTETVLHNFTYSGDGRFPDPGLVSDATRNLYGATPQGGRDSFGTVFELSPVPEIGISPANLTFAGQNRGTMSASQAVILNNSGNSALAITGIVTSVNFSERDGCNGSVPAHSSCTIDVTFSPKALGRIYGTLTVTDNTDGAPGNSQSVLLSGTGLAITGADLFLRINPSPTLVHQEDLITYAFPVWNLGPENADHEVLKTQVPEGTTFDYIRISGTRGLGTCTNPPYGGTGQIVCHENSSMAPNTTWTVRLTVKVTAPSGSVITENAAATADTPDPNTANNAAMVSTTVQ